MKHFRPLLSTGLIALAAACATPYDAGEQENLESLEDLDQASARLDALLKPKATPAPSPAAGKGTTEEPNTPQDVSRAIENYREIVKLAPQDRRVNFEAKRRLADLQVEVSELDPEAAAAGRVSTRESIDLYNSLLDSRPGAPDNDRILYQLARAYQNVGDIDLAVESLAELTDTFPKTALWTDAQFRRAELLFNQKNYEPAEAAYAQVMSRGPDTPYFEQAQYKYGWSIFKQDRYADSLDTFIAILDRELPVGAVKNLDATLEVVPRAQRELVRDVLRVVSLSFSYLGGGPAVTDYLKGQPVRSYEPVLYQNLATLFMEKSRFDDAAKAYSSLAERSPTHPLAPTFQAKVIEVYDVAGFDDLVLQAKIDYVNIYDLDQIYWTVHSREDSPEAFELLRSNMQELARHWHTGAQKAATRTEARPLFERATATYARYLDRFPEAGDRPEMNFLLAEAFAQNDQHAPAAEQFEITAWEYPAHARSAEAGYAAVLSRQILAERAAGEEITPKVEQSVATALRFVDSFAQHPEQPRVLLRAAEDLYRIEERDRAIEIAERVTALERPEAQGFKGKAWTLIGYAQMDEKRYPEAEAGLTQALAFATPGSPQATELRDNLATAIYRQGEAALVAEKPEEAVGHFLRVKEAAPGTPLAATGDFDAAATLINLEDWERAATELNGFRQRYPGHELQGEVTRKLAGVYLKDDKPLLAGAEFERIAGNPAEPASARQAAAWQAATLYDEAGATALARRTYTDYVQRFPQPYSQRLKAFERLIAISEATGDVAGNRRWLQALVAADRAAGPTAGDRSRTLAAKASLTLANDARERYERLSLTAQLNRSLPAKKKAMDDALAAYRQTAEYAIAEYTTEATFRIGALYADLARSLLDAPPPRGLSDLEREEYQFLLEDQAFPLEERAVEAHEVNTRRTLEAIYDQWVKASYTQLAKLLPARYAKTERREASYDALD